MKKGIHQHLKGTLSICTVCNLLQLQQHQIYHSLYSVPILLTCESGSLHELNPSSSNSNRFNLDWKAHRQGLDDNARSGWLVGEVLSIDIVDRPEIV